MEILIKYKALVLSAVLGVFALFIYNTGLIKSSGSRQLASIENCAEVKNLPKANDSTKNNCYYKISTNRSKGTGTLKVLNRNNTTSKTLSLNSMGHGENPTNDEVKSFFENSVKINGGQFIFSSGDSCKSKSKPCTPTKEDETGGKTNKDQAQKTIGEKKLIIKDNDEKDELDNERTPEGLLKSEFKELKDEYAGICFTSKDYNLLNIEIKGFERTVDQELDRAKDYLKKLKTKLEKMTESYSTSSTTKECAVVFKDERPVSESGESVDLPTDPAEQWSHYQKELLPKVREELASSGSLDGVAGLKELAEGNASVDKAVGVEVQAFTIAAAIRANISAIRLGRNTPGVNQSEISALERENAKQFAKLTALTSTSADGELTSPVASSAVAYWSDHFSKGLGELDKDGQGESLVGEILEGSEGTSANPTGNKRPTANQTVSPQAPIAPLAADQSNLDQFLVSVRSNYRNVRLALNGTRNSSNQKARSGQRARTNQRQTAPNNRNLAVPGTDRNTGSGSVQ